MLRNLAFLVSTSHSVAPTPLGRGFASRSRLRLSARGGAEDVDDDDDDDDYEYIAMPSLDTMKQRDEYTGFVVQVLNSGTGAVVDIGAEINGFVPISKVADGRVEDINAVVKKGDSIPVWVAEVKPEEKKLVLAMACSKAFGLDGIERDMSVFADIDASTVLRGQVVKTAPFGAFVAVKAPNGKEAQGLVHVSEMSNEFVSDAAEKVTVGDWVDVRIKSVDASANKIALSMKDPSEAGSGSKDGNLAAFADVKDTEWLTGKVKNFESYGAFVEVSLSEGGPTAEGLLHISQIGQGFVQDPAEVLEMDQEVKVRIIECNLEKGKLSLSMKEG